ncbi:MAG: hypothetical protein ACWGKN_10260 [Desulfoprunum sp.]
MSTSPATTLKSNLIPTETATVEYYRQGIHQSCRPVFTPEPFGWPTSSLHAAIAAGHDFFHDNFRI